MASLDVDSLFTNIPLDETIDICIDSLYKDDENSPEIPKDVFLNVLTVATKELFLCLTTNSINRLMSPLGPALANSFMSSFENK